MVVTGVRLSVTRPEDRATLRSDPSAALGPKSHRDDWKAFFPGVWRFETPFLVKPERLLIVEAGFEFGGSDKP
jgi:hypothetical protein